MAPPRPPRLKIETPADKSDVDPLVSALERVYLGAKDEDADNWIDEILDLQRPRKRIKQDQEELKRSLEEKFLTPSATFSPEWLNKLQQ
jgi:antiviral helicase SKI2